MPARPIPIGVFNAVESVAPGLIHAFINELVLAHDGIDLTGTVLTSFYRSPADNVRVGGNPDSQHQIGLGIDIVYGSRDAKQWASQAMKARGLVVVDEGDHVHVQALPRGLARQTGLLQAAIGPAGATPVV